MDNTSKTTNPDQISPEKKLANDHWGYIESLLEAHHVLNATIDQIGFHYKSAFIHGYKHGVEDYADELRPSEAVPRHRAMNEVFADELVKKKWVKSDTWGS